MYRAALLKQHSRVFNFFLARGQQVAQFVQYQNLEEVEVWGSKPVLDTW